MMLPGLACAIAALLAADVARASAPSASGCAAAKLQAAAKNLADQANCHARALRNGTAADAGCLAKADAKLLAKFARLASRGGCLATDDAAAVQTTIDAALAALLSEIPATTSTVPPTTTTSTSLPPPLCGNGVRDAGEQCDGGNLCTASCTLTGLAYGCCDFPNDHVPACLAADGWSLDFNMYSYCLAQGSSQHVPGGVCGASGDCEVVAIDPVPLCCQAAGSCSDGTAGDSAGLWSFYNHCEGLTSFSSHTVVAASCVDGVCTPS